MSTQQKKIERFVAGELARGVQRFVLHHGKKGGKVSAYPAPSDSENGAAARLAQDVFIDAGDDAEGARQRQTYYLFSYGEDASEHLARKAFTVEPAIDPEEDEDPNAKQVKGSAQEFMVQELRHRDRNHRATLHGFDTIMKQQGKMIEAMAEENESMRGTVREMLTGFREIAVVQREAMHAHTEVAHKRAEIMDAAVGAKSEQLKNKLLGDAVAELLPLVRHHVAQTIGAPEAPVNGNGAKQLPAETASGTKTITAEDIQAMTQEQRLALNNMIMKVEGIPTETATEEEPEAEQKE